MKDFLEIVTLVLSVVLPIGGIIWGLITIYYKKEKDLQLLKQGLTDESIRNLENLVREMSISITSHKVSLSEIETKLGYTIASVDSAKNALSKVSDSTDSFVRNSERRLAILETKLEQISQNLFRIKSK